MPRSDAWTTIAGLRGDNRDVGGDGEIEAEMHLLVDFFAFVDVGARVGEFRLDLRVAQLLERSLEKHLGRRLLRQVGQVLIVLPPQVAVDLQEACQQIVSGNLLLRRVAGDGRYDAAEELVVDLDTALRVRLGEHLMIECRERLVARRVAREDIEVAC